MSIQCERCHYATSQKSHMLNHLHRNKPCPCFFSDVPREDIISSILKPHPCVNCQKIFMSKKCLENHIKICKEHNVGSVASNCRHNNSLMVNNNNSDNTIAMNNSTIDHSTIDNSTTTTTMNISKITINNFGSEDRSYIDNNTLKECVETARVIPLIMDVYFNSDHPENHTIKLKSEKLSRVVVHNEGKWIECDMNSSIDSMMQLERNSMTNYYWTDVASNPNVTDKIKLDTLQNIGEFCKTSLKYFEERRNIHAILKNVKNQTQVW